VQPRRRKLLRRQTVPHRTTSTRRATSNDRGRRARCRPVHRRVSPSQAWATPFEACSPIRRFTSHKRQRHLSGL
jgi:hypothetical protein